MRRRRMRTRVRRRYEEDSVEEDSVEDDAVDQNVVEEVDEDTDEEAKADLVDDGDRAAMSEIVFINKNEKQYLTHSCTEQ